MPTEEVQNKLTNPKILSKEYWLQALLSFKDVKMLAIGSLIVALRVAVKFLSFQIAPGVEMSFDCYVNALGSLIYGPLFGLLVGAVSDTLGCILHPTGAYFFPFIFVEMSSSFIFGLFLWKRKLSCPRILLSKFSVNFFSNIILNSLILKYYMVFICKEAYSFVNLTRIVKNLVLFPLEAVLITVIIGALEKPFKALGILSKEQKYIRLTKKDIALIGILFVLSVGIVLFYIFFLKDYISAHNIKLW